MDINTIVQVIVGCHCNGRIGIARLSDGGIGIGPEKYRFVRDKVYNRKPHVELSCKKLGIIHPDGPNAYSGSFETHKYQLSSGADFN